MRERLPQDLQKDYHLYSFSQEIPTLLQAADIVISRAGATSLAEIAACQKPAIIIPYPFASLDHQRKNAHILGQSQAAIILDPNDLTDEKLFHIIGELSKDQKRQKSLISHLAQFNPQGATEKIIQEIGKIYEN